MSSVPPRPHEGAYSSRRALLGSNLLDASGRQLSNVAIDILAVTVLGATAVQIGLLNAVGSTAFLLLGIPIGVFIDRHPTVRLLVGSGIVRALLLLTVAVAAWLGSLTFLHLIIVTGVVGIGTVVTETAQTALVPRVVETSGIKTLVARMQSADSAAGLIVPGIAGIIIAFISPGSVLGIGAGVMACGALIAAFVRLRKRENSRQENSADEQVSSEDSGLPSFFSDAAEGWQILTSHAELWRVTLSSMVINLSLAIFSAVEAILILRTLGLGAPALGFAASAGATGALLGSLGASRILSRHRTHRVLIAAAWLLPLSAALTSVSIVDRDRALAWILAGAFLWGAAIVSYNITKATRVAELAPIETLGRISALGRTLSMGVVPGGSISGGLLAGWIGMAPVLGIWIALTVIGACIVITARPADGSQVVE